MRVILLENIASVGSLGDVINVRPGYARNYLFPQGKAERASSETIKQFESRRAELQKRQEGMEAALTKAHEALNGYLLQLTARASPDGNLYGSITPQMLAAAVNAQRLAEGFTIKRGQISLPGGQIKSLGEHTVNVRLGTDAVASFTLSVLAEAAAPSHSTQETTTDETSSDNTDSPKDTK